MQNTQSKTKTKAKKSSRSLSVTGSEVDPRKLTVKGKIDRGLFLEWFAIPNMLRMLPETEVKKMGYPTDDVVFLKMLRCKTQTEFCTEFGVSINMPAKWKSEPNFMAELNAISDNSNVMRFKKEVDFSFTQKVIRHGDAHRVKLWKQLNEGWSERQEHVNLNLSMTPADLVSQIEARNAKIREAVVEEEPEIEDEED